MARILFLTYYYAPCNAVAANRPNSFTRNLVRKGHSVTVITRHWKGTEKMWRDYLLADESVVEIRNEGGATVHYLPYKAYHYWPGPLTLIGTTWQNLKGNFNYEQQYNQYAGYAEQLLQQKGFDYILVSTPPLTTLKTGGRLARKFNIPLLVDVRDFENDVLLYKERKHGWLRQQQHRLLMHFFKKWVQPAKAIVTASPPLTEYIARHTGQTTVTLNNGFNEELLTINEPTDKEWFNITVTGTLYEMANLPVMLKTCELVMQRHPEAKIRFRFIGLLANQKVSDMFKRIVPEKNIELTHRVQQAKALKIASASQVLMLAGFDEMRGAYTTKIFEYLGLRRNIIQIPGDRDVVEELIVRTQSGKAPHTAEEACSVIMNWYAEWERDGRVTYKADMAAVMEYSREKQFEKLSAYITA